MLASTASSPQTDLRLGDHKNPAASGTRFLLQLHHPGMASNPHRPSRLHRRLSHPPSSSAGRARTEQEDGEFIKRAFENLALDPSHALSSSTPLYTPSTGGSAFTSAGENADNATNNMESTAPTHYAYSTGSRMSIASTSSQPYSSLSGYTQVDRASIRSSQPLISHDPSDLSASPPSALPGRRRHFRAISSDNHKSNGESSNSSRPSLDSWRPDQNESIGNYTSGERRPTFSWFRPNLSIQPTSAIQAHDNGVWSDPFSEDFRERQLPRLRRSSTISGYSVNTSDWNSLRRGSLASLEHPSPTSATNNDGNNAATSYSYSLARSRNPSNNNGHEQATTATGDATPASAYANMARSQQSPTSLRWEAWAAAYRESLLQDVRNDRVSYAKLAQLLSVRAPTLLSELTSRTW